MTKMTKITKIDKTIFIDLSWSETTLNDIDWL